MGALITKTAQYANKLLKKPDQCRMVTLCSHLFWPKDPPTIVDGEEEPSTHGARYADCDRVLECMQRSLKIASVCNPNIFVEILDRYIFYFENNNPLIHVRYLSGLIALINEQMGSEDGGQGAAAQPMGSAVKAHYRNTLEYIRNRQRSPETSEKFSAIQL